MFNNNSIVLNNMNSNYQTNGGYYNSYNGYNNYNPYLANNQYQAMLEEQRQQQEMQNKIHNVILQNACTSMNITQEEFMANYNQYGYQPQPEMTEDQKMEMEINQLNNLHFTQYETVQEYEARMQNYYNNNQYRFGYNRQPVQQELPEVPNVGIAELDKILAPTLEMLEQEKVSNYRKNLSGTYGGTSYRNLVRTNSNGYGSYNDKVIPPVNQVGGNFNLDDMTISLPPNLTSSALDARRNEFLNSITIG